MSLRVLLRAAASVVLAGVTAVAGPAARADEVQPFSLSAAALLELARAPARREAFPVVFQREAIRYEFDAGHRLTLTAHQIYRIDSADAVEEYGQIGTAWEPYRQHRPELRARVVTPDGREHRFDAATLSDETLATGDARKFDDLHYLRGPLPAIAPGSVVELETVVRDKEPKFASGSSYTLTVGAHGAVEDTVITVAMPREFPFRFRALKLPQAVVTETDAGERRVFTLRQGPLALEWEKLFVEAAGDVPLWPRLEFSTGGSWEAVAGAYGRLVDAAIRPEEVRSLLPADLPAEPRPRLARLLEILHERVRYTGVFFGQGDIVPNPPAVTLERRYGDCKDKSVVLASLLQAAGMPAQIVLLNSGADADVDPDLPGIGGFNHMIVHLPGQDLWIDATAEFLGAGDAPYENSNRWALVIGRDPSPLVRTPAMQPAQNREIEQRAVKLADIGPGEVHLAARVNGVNAAIFRQLAKEGDTETRENVLKQFRENFSAKSSSGYAVREDPAQGGVLLDVDLHRVETAMTTLQESGIVMSLNELFGSLPYGLRAKPPADEDDKDEKSPDARPETRSVDWVFQPFVSEMEVRVVPPPGFRLRSLPKGGDQQFGPLVLAQEYREEADGSLAGHIRVDSGRGRYSADEGRAFREAWLAAENTLQLAIRFDHESWLLARNGKAAEAFRRHEAFIAQAPKKAMPRVRAAAQLLEFGLVDEALAQAQRATQLEPDNAWAFNMLGLVLQSDALGRRLGGPFDRAGAIRAAREAVKRDPDDMDMKLNLAMAAQFNAEGVRFGPGSDLDLAVEQFRTIVDKLPDWQPGPEYLVQALWQQRKVDEVIVAADKSPGSEFVASARLAARAVKAGTEAALREDASRTSAAAHRARIGAAMALHWAQRNYAEARALLAALGTEGLPQQGASVTELLDKVVRTEERPAPAATPAGAAESLVRLMFSDAWDRAQVTSWLSDRARTDNDIVDVESEFKRGSGYVSAGISRRIGGDPAFVRDLVLSNMGAEEADFTTQAKRVNVTLGGMKVGAFYLVPEDGWKLLAMSAYGAPVAREAQRRLDAGDAAGARAWLAAVKAEIEVEEDSDTGPYRHFLAALPTTSALDDPVAQRLAALALLAARAPESGNAEILRRAAEGLTTPAQQEVLEAARFAIAAEKRDGALALAAAENFERLKPGSPESLRMRALALGVAGRWSESEQASRTWMTQRPGDGAARQALVRALNEQGRFAEALAVLAPDVQSGRAEPSDQNNFAWQSLRAGAVDAAAVRAAENAYNQRRSYSVGHTLACLYAEQGRPAEARRVLLKILEDHPTADPLADEIWLVRGMIAEALGESQAAVKAYRQIEKPEQDAPDSVHALAAARLARLET